MKKILLALILVLGVIGGIQLQAQGTLITDPADGHYCSGTGNGVAIGIDNSVLSQVYQLRKQPSGTIVGTMTGNGALRYFGEPGPPLLFTAGTYYVTLLTPLNSVTILEVPTPVIPLLVSDPVDGHYCNYATPPGVTLKVTNSVSGASYQLYTSGVPVGSPLSGGTNPLVVGTSLLEGTYYVIATQGNCTSQSADFIVVADTPPTADFTFPPGTENICASSPIQFIDASVPGAGNTLTHWLWNFDDPPSGPENTSSANPNVSHIFEAIGCGTPSRDYNVSLTVTDNNGCSATSVQPIKVRTKPDATLTANPDASIDPMVFSSCINTIYSPSATFLFSNGSSTVSCNTSYNISWGPGSTPSMFSGNSFTEQTVTYSGLGIHYPLVYTVNNESVACSNTKNYTVYLGNFPNGNLTLGPHQQYGVEPYDVSLEFHPDCYTNSPGTTYHIDYGDGTVLEIDQSTLPPPPNRKIYHTYQECQFPKISQCLTDERFGFKIFYRIENECDANENQICPIVVQCKTIGTFSIGTGIWGTGGGGQGWFPGDTDQDHLYGCQNGVIFTSNISGGVYINGNGTTAIPYTDPGAIHYQWNFGPNATPSTSTMPNPTVIFSVPGNTYTVTLVTWVGPGSPPTNLTADTITKYVYIQSPPAANFSTDYSALANICVPYIVKVTNQSDEGGTLGGKSYQWKVKRDGIYVTDGYDIVTPLHLGDDHYPEPWFQFNVSGNWELEMTLTNSCGSSVKLSDPMIICQPPAVSFSTPDISICGPSYVVQVCPSYNENCSSGSVTYTWQTPLPGGATFVPPDNASTPCPHINFPAVGNYSLTVTIENICDQATATQVVHITDPITNNILDPNGLITSTTFCGCINTPMTIEGSTPVGGALSYIYQWQSATSPGGPWTNIVIGGLAKDYTIPAPICQTICYRRLVFDQGDCESVSAPICFNMVPVIQNNLIASSQSLCAGQIPSMLMGSSPTGGDGTFLFFWEMEIPSGNNTWEVVSTVKDYQPGPVITTTTYRRVVVSGPCVDISSSIVITACDPISNNDIKITVSGTDYTSYEICSGTQPPQITGSTPAGGCNLFTYQWQQSVAPPFIGFADITTGGTGQHYTPPALTQTTHYRRIVKPDPATGCVDHISNEMIIIVNPNPTASGFVSPPNIPQGASANLFGNASGGTPFTSQPTYQYCWEPAAYVAGANCQQNVITVPMMSPTIFTLQVTDAKGCTGTATIPAISIDLLNCSEITSPNYAIPIHACPGCPNGPVSLSVSANGGTGSYSYSWYEGGILIGTTATIQVCPSATTTYSCTVTDGLTSCTKSIVVTVDPAPVITNPTSTINICSCSAVNFTPTSNVTGTTYIWTVTSPTGGTPVTSTGGTIINDVLCNFATSVITYTYTITPTGPAPTYCVGTPFMLTVNVAPVASVTTSPNSQVVVPATPTLTTPVILTSDVGGAEFSWSGPAFPTPCVVSSNHPSGTGNLLAMTLTLITSPPPTCTLPYTVIPSYQFTGGPTCPGNNYTYTYIFNAQPTIFTLQCPPLTNVCDGTTVTLTLNGSETGVSYQLMNGTSAVSSPITGTNAPVTWIVSVSGSYFVVATNSSNGQSVNMNGMCTVTVNPLPDPTFEIGSTGNCPGAYITLSGSQPNVNYQLYVGASPIGSPIPGNSSALNFGQQFTPGLYTLKASYNYAPFCSQWINGSVVLNTGPQQFTLLPPGNGCACDDITLSGSETFVTYQLYCEPVSGNPQLIGSGVGTGGPIDFGNPCMPGTYRVYAYNQVTLCSTWMISEKILEANPVVYSILPSGGPNCGQTTIQLQNSQAGYFYQVHQKIGGIIQFPGVFPEVIGTGSMITFGTTAVPGTYVVVGYNPARICSSVMNGEVIIQESPAIFPVNPTGTVCVDTISGVEVTLASSDLYVTYTLTNGFQNWVQPGTGFPLSFGFITIPGTYSVTAQHNTNGCGPVTMAGSLTLLIPPVQIVNAGPNQVICSGEQVQLNGSVTGGTVTGTWSGGYGTFIPNPSILNPVYIPAPAEWGTTVTLTLTSTNTQLCPNNSDNVQISIHAPLVSGVAGPNQTVCLGELPEAISISPASGGSGMLTYQWQMQIGTSWSNIPGAYGLNYTPPLLSLTTRYRNIQTDVYCNPDQQVISNEVTITVAAWPLTGYVVSSNSTCPGSWVVQNGSQSGVNYELYRDGIPTGIIRPGFGPLDYGAQWTPGTYTVKATTQGSDCSVWISGSVVIIPMILPANAGPIIGPDTVCKGAMQIQYQVAPITGATDYIWVMPSGATIESGAHTSQIRVRFQPNFTSGNILVYGMNDCAAGQYSMLPVVGKTLTGTLTLSGDTVKSGDTFCYAKEEIWTGNVPAPYIIEPGGSVSLSTMKAVHLLPGTVVRHGGHLSAITTTCLPCSFQKIAEAENSYQDEFQTNEYQAVSSQGKKMVIFPNPSDGVVFVMLSGVPAGEKVRIEITDLRGQRLLSETIVNKKVNRVPRFESPPGIYLVRAVSPSSGVSTGKVIIR